MYNLAPISLKPDVRASKTHHAAYLNKFVQATKVLCKETEVVGYDNADVKEMFALLDKLFHYGLLSGTKAYWSFVKEFLPSNEQQMLRVACGEGNDRKLSLWWLKDSLNKGTLGFQMLGFGASPRTIARYYHRHAFISNHQLMTAATKEVELLSNVQFSISENKPSAYRSEPLQAIEVASPQPRVVKKIPQKGRKVEPRHPVRPIVPNVLPNPAQSSGIGSLTDPDVILDDIVRHRLLPQRVNVYEEDINEEPPPIVVREPQPMNIHFEQVMSKTLSNAKICELLVQPKSFEDHLMVDEINRKQQEKDEVVEGEELLVAGQESNLALNVFDKSNEKVQRAFHVYDSFAVGTVSKVMLLITNYHIYTIHVTHINGEEIKQVYNKKMHVLKTDIESIAIGTDYQTIIFYAKPGCRFVLDSSDYDNDKMIVLSTGDEKLGRTIVSVLENTITKLSILQDESSPYQLRLKSYVEREIKVAPNTDIMHLSFVFWKEDTAIKEIPSVQGGYLFWRFCQGSWWKKDTGDNVQNYFLLQNRKLYVFADSCMKQGIVIYDLRNCQEIGEMEQKKDCNWSFELTLPEGNLVLTTSSKEDLCKWIQQIHTAVNQPKEEEAATMAILTKSHLVIAQEGNKFITDGFARTLIKFSLTEIRNGWIVKTETHTALVLRVDNTYQYLYFRTKDELSRMVATVTINPINLEELDEGSRKNREDQFILAQLGRTEDLWRRTVEDKDVEEVKTD